MRSQICTSTRTQGFARAKQRCNCKKDRCQFAPILPIVPCLIIRECPKQASDGREAPKARRAFGHTRAQLCWAIVHKENIIFFGLAARLGQQVNRKCTFRALLNYLAGTSNFCKYKNKSRQSSPARRQGKQRRQSKLIPRFHSDLSLRTSCNGDDPA